MDLTPRQVVGMFRAGAIEIAAGGTGAEGAVLELVPGATGGLAVTAVEVE